MRSIPIEPLTRQAFAPFGEVIEITDAAHFPINAGLCTRYHELARVEVTGDNGRPIISLLRGDPYALPYSLRFVERHPLGSQAFMPLGDQPFLVIVAGDTPDGPARPKAFRTARGQGVNIGRNVWHGILTPLGAVSDFLVVDRAGEGNNLEEFTFDAPYLVADASLPGFRAKLFPRECAGSAACAACPRRFKITT